MWFNQYERVWAGPWFHVGDTIVPMAGFMALHDRTSSLLVIGDVDSGRLNVADQ